MDALDVGLLGRCNFRRMVPLLSRNCQRFTRFLIGQFNLVWPTDLPVVGYVVPVFVDFAMGPEDELMLNKVSSFAASLLGFNLETLFLRDTLSSHASRNFALRRSWEKPL